MSRSSFKHFLTLFLFSLALFISAAAMFVLQLMVGKMLLPLTGGTPSGWIVALAFFQNALLAGYALTFWLSRYSPRIHGRIYLIMLIAGAMFLPVILPHQVDQEIGPLLVLRLLIYTAGIPAVALATTSSTLQRLFASTGHVSGEDPYFLYAASNLGSMIGLLLYPLAIETTLTLSWQTQIWSWVYVLLTVLGAGCLLLSGRQGKAGSVVAAPSPSWKKRAEWITLSFFPSSLLLGVTMYITTDLIAAPLVWVVPLTLYLLTFVVAFSRLPFVSRDSSLQMHPAIALVALMLAVMAMNIAHLPWVACWHLLAFTIIALFFHVRLAHLRPATPHLSEYYLMLAVGGALGGVLNAFIAPLVFTQLTEYPLIAILACLFHPSLRPLLQRQETIFYAFALSLGAASWYLMRHDLIDQMDLIIVVVLALTAYAPRIFVVSGMVILLVAGAYAPTVLIRFQAVQSDFRERNFFGMVNVYQTTVKADTMDHPVRVLMHGTTLHGYQILSPGFETQPTAYYSNDSPLGDIFKAINPAKIAVIGLGTGTTACYGTPERQFTFFEIDPAIIEIARNQFTFLEKCHAGREHRIFEGDGRLELAKLRDEKFDLIILDAFSSDMIPAHLLTREAIMLYLSHLEQSGTIAFHTSNRYLQLEKLLAATATDFNLDYRWKQENENGLGVGSAWFVLGSNGSPVASLDAFNEWKKITAPAGMRPWTDDFSNVLSIRSK